MMGFPLRASRWGVSVGLALAVLYGGGDAQAQLFGGDGLFNRKKKNDPLAPKTYEEIGVPTPVTGRVEAVKGQEVRFEIHAETKTPAAAVEFLIRTFPSAGRIVSMVSNPNRRNRAIVTYYADPDSSAESDAFAFAVRYRGGRYSSAMRYDIDLVGGGSSSSEVVVSSSLDFGEVAIGDEAQGSIVVQNLGSATFERNLFLAPPWYLVEPRDGKLVLGGGGSREVKLAFRPDLEGDTSYFFSFSRSKRGTTELTGKGLLPFKLVNEELELSLDEDGMTRKGAIQLQNLGKKPVRLAVRASSRLQQSLQKEYFLPPEKTTSIGVGLGQTDTAPFDGMVEFALENGYAQTARVLAPVVPAHLEISIPNSLTTEVINFGQVEAGRSTERGFTVTNRGGVAVPLEFHIPEPFRLLTNPGPQLAPLSSVSLSVGLYPPAGSQGPVDVTMNVYGVDQTLDLRLLGNVVRAKGAPRAPAKQASPLAGIRFGAGASAPGASTPGSSGGAPSSAGKEGPGNSSTSSAGVGAADAPPSLRPDGPALTVPAGGPPIGLEDDDFWWAKYDEEEVAKLRSPLGHVTRPLFNREMNPELRRPEDLSLVEAGADSLTIGWTAPRNSKLYSFGVELAGMHVAPDDGAPDLVWIPYGRVEFERIDRLVKARIHDLIPDTNYEIRVFTVDENGRSSHPSEAMVAKTELPMDWTYIYLTLAILLVGGVGYGVFRVVRDRRPEVYQAQYVDS